MYPEGLATVNGDWTERYWLGSNGANETSIVVADPVASSAAREITQVAPVATPPIPALGGDVRDVSIVMADLRGFTAFCERVPLDQMSRVLNEYLTAMVDVILGHNGRVQDFVGDGILGVFGAPSLDPNHAWHATLCALEMQRAIRKLCAHWATAESVTFDLGVAVHSGQVFAGAVGCAKQRKYAVVGDPVNTVARLEELNRVLGTQIVMSRDSLALVHDRVDVHPKGTFTVRGRSHAVEVFELLDIREAIAHPSATGSALREL